jgi:hypothetical protein
MAMGYAKPLFVAAIVLVVFFSNVHPSFGKGQSWLGITSEKYGYGVQQSRVGMPLLVSQAFLNTGYYPQNFTVVFDIRSQNVSLQLAWKSGVANPFDRTFVSTSWIPKSAGEYQVRAFILSNFTRPELLQDVSMFQFKIISDEDFSALYSDRPTGFEIIPVAPAGISQKINDIKFETRLQFANDINSSNTYVGDISVVDNSLFLIGTTEIPPLRENPPKSGGNILVFFAASNDMGASSAPAKYLTNNTRALIFTHDAKVHAVNDTLVYASWLQHTPWSEARNAVFARSLDGGKTFGHAIMFDAAGYGFQDMAVSKNGDSVYLLRADVYDYNEANQYGLLLDKSHDFGSIFEPTRLILNYTGIGVSCTQIAVQETNRTQDKRVYLTWRESSDDNYMKVVFAASHDGGKTFGSPVVVRQAYAEDWDCPKFGTYGDEVYLAWIETKLLYKAEDPAELLVGDSDVFFAASRDGGQAFESPVNISEGIGAFTSELELLASDGRIYAVWRDTIPQLRDGFMDFYGNAEVVMTKSLDGGKTFDTPVNLSDNPTDSYRPSIAANDNTVLVVWLESAFPSDQATVSLRSSNDGGNTFAKVDEDLMIAITEPLGRPQIQTSADGHKLYVLWSQRQENSYEAQNYILVGEVR